LSDITHASGVSKQTINSALRKLEAEGMIYLETLGARRKRVCLTEHGKSLAERTVFRLIEIENEILGSWSEGEREIYMELTQRYLISFKEKLREM
ncbi:MAG: MarR family transcriptional regulator, partial [Lachnospiraceae bacterium]|nr:MarR family transcriptional regulator [Lachnospiraceae bacterium]